jgi:hypothetical protein
MSAQAQGIPDKADYGRIENIPLRKILAYVDQLHKADRAGLHHDIRFGDKELYSWAGKKGLPTPGNKDIVFQQPLHSPEYAGFEGEIASGYGKGVVKTHDRGSVFVTEVNPDKIKFVLAHRKNPEYYTMIKLKGDRRPWLIINHTPTNPEKVTGSKEAFKKKHLGVIPAENVAEVLNGVVEGKIDGASGLFKLKQNAVDVMSFRVGKDNRPIMHTERFFGEGSAKFDIPKKFVNRVARGEIYSVDGKGRPQNAQTTSPLLNMSLENSLKAQKEKGLGLRAALFGFADKPLNYPEREKELTELLKYLPKEKFGRPPVAHTPESARTLWDEIAKGKHPETDEGIVAYPQEGNPVKVKLRPDYDVKITDVFPGEGKYKGSAGGIVYEGGGRVGTGFDDNYRKWIWDNREAIKGRIAKITSTKKLPSGKYYQPSFVSLHEDYPTKKAGSVPLVVHSIHGDEPAGEAAAKNLDGVNVVDAGNHTGKRKMHGKDLNRHFGKKDASKQNKAILDKIIKARPSLLIDLHEDNTKDKAYAYASGDMAEKVKNILRKSKLPIANSAEGDKTDDGVIVGGKYPGEGSLVMEANKKGIPYVLLEAPGKESMSTRVNFLKKVVKQLVNEKRGADFAPDYTPDQLKEMGVFDEVYARTKPRLASLNTWPAHWFHPEDKMGWLEWYEKYNAGRRMEDDARQIKRWNAFRSRHGGQMFQNNPTPRRAYALRNWGIDPVKLLNNEEKKVKLIEAMQAYKSKKYDKIEKNV